MGLERALLGGVFALAALSACRLPSTVGLACQDDSQCLGPGAQWCDTDQGDGVCVEGTRPEGDDGGDDDTSADAGESEESESETGEMKMDMEAPDMGPQCGAAIGSCDKIDILLVIDNSGSMTNDELQDLLADPDFVDELLPALTTEPCDVQVGITTTDPAPGWQPEPCRTIGALNQGSAFADDCWGDNPPYYRSGDDVNGLLCAIVPGNEYDPDEQQINALIRGIEPDMTGEGACNEGFIRDDAKLLLLLITDEDDDDDGEDLIPFPGRTGSGGDPQEWFGRITAVKDPADVGFLGIVPTSQAACGDFMPLSGDEDAVPGTAEFAERITTFGALWLPTGNPQSVEVINLCQDIDDVVDEVRGARDFLDGFCNG